MAKVIENSSSSRTIRISSPLWRGVMVGIIAGVIWWVLMSSISQLTKSATIPGDVAIIITATIATAVMVGLRMTMPLVVSVGVAVSLWGMQGWIKDIFWVEQIAWVVLLYVLAYVALSWSTRFKRLIPALIAVIITVLLVRLSLAL